MPLAFLPELLSVAPSPAAGWALATVLVSGALGILLQLPASFAWKEITRWAQRLLQPVTPHGELIDPENAIETWWRVMRLFETRELFYMAVVLAATLISAVFDVFLPKALGRAINAFSRGSALNLETTNDVLLIAVGGAVKSAAEYFREGYGNYIGKRI
jgi:hypothetical protein